MLPRLTRRIKCTGAYSIRRITGRMTSRHRRHLARTPLGHSEHRPRRGKQGSFSIAFQSLLHVDWLRRESNAAHWHRVNSPARVRRRPALPGRASGNAGRRRRMASRDTTPEINRPGASGTPECRASPESPRHPWRAHWPVPRRGASSVRAPEPPRGVP
jgi:hypothetical protein